MSVAKRFNARYETALKKAHNHFKASKVTARAYGIKAGEVIQETVDCGPGVSFDDGERAHDFGQIVDHKAKDPSHRVNLGLDAMADLDALAIKAGIKAEVHAANMARAWAAYQEVA